MSTRESGGNQRGHWVWRKQQFWYYTYGRTWWPFTPELNKASPGSLWIVGVQCCNVFRCTTGKESGSFRRVIQAQKDGIPSLKEDSGVRKVTHLTNKGEQWKTKRHTLLNIGVQQTELTTDIDISFSYFFPLLNQTHLNSHFLWGGGGGGVSLGARVTWPVVLPQRY